MELTNSPTAEIDRARLLLQEPGNDSSSLGGNYVPRGRQDMAARPCARNADRWHAPAAFGVVLAIPSLQGGASQPHGVLPHGDGGLRTQGAWIAKILLYGFVRSEERKCALRCLRDAAALAVL